MRIRRVVIDAPGVAVLAEAALPDTALGPFEVLLRTRFSLISPGTELAYFKGDQDLGHRSAWPYPFVPGYAAVGEIVDAGGSATVRPGAIVLAHTPHQSIARFDLREVVCAAVPDAVQPGHAAMARLAQVGAVSVMRMSARSGATAAVVGLGPVGICAAQLLRARGLEVIGVDTLAARRALAARCGISRALLHDDPAIEALRDSCGVVFECSGSEAGLLTALSLAARHGEVFLVGALWKRSADTAAADVVRPVFDKYLALRSGWEWQLPRYGEGSGDSVASCTRWVLRCMAAGSLQVAELITDIRPPSEARQAYALLLDRPAAHMGVLFDWADGP